MTIQETIDRIVSQEQKEIRNYNLFAGFVILCFFVLLSFNLIGGYIKDIAPALTNFLTLAVGYVPFQQIIRRRKKIYYLDKIVRPEVDDNAVDKEDYITIIKETVKDGLKN